MGAIELLVSGDPMDSDVVKKPWLGEARRSRSEDGRPRRRLRLDRGSTMVARLEGQHTVRRGNTANGGAARGPRKRQSLQERALQSRSADSTEVAVVNGSDDS